MASGLYASFKQLLLGGDIDLAADTIKAVLVDTADYTVNLATHDFLDDVPSAGRVGTPQTLASKTITSGVFDAADVTFPGVTGDPTEGLLIYKDTGSEATSPLIAWFDGAALNFIPNGGDCTVAWNASGIFAL